MNVRNAPVLTRGGRSNSGKQMLRCKSCGHRFTTNIGQLSWYSHQDESKWNSLIQNTLEVNSIMETAADLDVSPSTAFRMRHKFLVFLAEAVESTCLVKPCEIDETFMPESHKGFLQPETNTSADEESRKRGVSDDKACLMTGIERGGTVYMHAYNMGRPAAEEVKPFFMDHIEPGTYIWTDGESSFTGLMKQNKCPFRIVKSTTEGDQVNNLETVNHLHSAVKEIYRRYRGVSTVYLNRYANLFTIKQQYRDYDTQEILIILLGKFRKVRQYFFVRELMDTHLFEEPRVMAVRNRLRSLKSRMSGICLNRASDRKNFNDFALANA